MAIKEGDGGEIGVGRNEMKHVLSVSFLSAEIDMVKVVQKPTRVAPIIAYVFSMRGFLSGQNGSS